ncbi:unnamed protein product [Anisakis simplex]|uniref:Eukaryotic translation initiation factor 2A n=1 Tax=Anisakis simplex TaxID=6269 RepID=A0A0M3J8Y9_ANISI|nr:unnamed protein product [Anisakis simplex]
MDVVPGSGFVGDTGNVSMCTPLKIYPLGGERVQELSYPPITYHYSVGTNARHVYVIGALTENNHSQLYVWDLHRGCAK